MHVTRHAARAFSLLELLVAMGIIVTAVVLIVGVFTSALRPGAKAIDLTSGTVVAESELHRFVYSIQSNQTSPTERYAFFNAAYNAPPNAPTTGSVTLSGTNYRYAIYYQTVNDWTGQPLGEVSTTAYPDENNYLKAVNVVVWWWSKSSDATRHGYGKLRTEATTLMVYDPGQ